MSLKTLLTFIFQVFYNFFFMIMATSLRTKPFIKRFPIIIMRVYPCFR